MKNQGRSQLLLEGGGEVGKNGRFLQGGRSPNIWIFFFANQRKISRFAAHFLDFLAEKETT